MPQSGSGSGFVYDNQGHIVTNNHVVEGASQIEVKLANGTSIPAEVVGTDAYYDIAIIKVDDGALNVPPLRLGESQNLQVGQQVLAIGNPFGLDGTLTTGVIVHWVARSNLKQVRLSATSFRPTRLSIPVILAAHCWIRVAALLV